MGALHMQADQAAVLLAWEPWALPVPVPGWAMWQVVALAPAALEAAAATQVALLLAEEPEAPGEPTPAASLPTEEGQVARLARRSGSSPVGGRWCLSQAPAEAW